MGVCKITVKRTRLQSSNTGRVRFTVISHTPMRSRLYHTHIMYNWNWDGFCLVNLIYFALNIFQIRNLLNCVDESLWNMSFKETRLGDGVMLLPLCLHAATLWRHAVWIRIVTSQNAWMGYEYSFTNIILTPSKQWGACDFVAQWRSGNIWLFSEALMVPAPWALIRVSRRGKYVYSKCINRM